MKSNKIFYSVLIVAAILLMSAVSQIRVGQIVGDKSGDKTLWQLIKERPTLAVADARYSAKGDTLTATDYFYTKTEVDAKTRKGVEKLTRLFGDASEKIIIPSVANNTIFSGSYTIVNGSSIGTFFTVEDTCIVNKVGIYLSNDAVYTTSADTTTIFNGVALYLVNKSTLAKTKLTQTPNTPTCWDAGATPLLRTLNFNAQQTLIPLNIYWAEAFPNFATVSTAPTILSHGGAATRNFFGYYYCGIDDTDLYPATTKNNPADYAGLSSVPGLILYIKP